MIEQSNVLEQLQAALSGLPAFVVDDPRKTVIFTVDMNNGFVKEGALASQRAAAILPQTATFLKRHRELGVTVAAVTDTHPADSFEFSSYPPHCVVGTVESEIVGELLPFVDVTFPKNSTNAVFVPEIVEFCKGFDTVVITGCCTDICIHQFAVGLKAFCNQQHLPIRVVVPVSLVDTFDAPGHSAAFMNAVFLGSMRANGVELVG